jgi:hypothetical protein
MLPNDTQFPTSQSYVTGIVGLGVNVEGSKVELPPELSLLLPFAAPITIATAITIGPTQVNGRCAMFNPGSSGEVLNPTGDSGSLRRFAFISSPAFWAMYTKLANNEIVPHHPVVIVFDWYSRPKASAQFLQRRASNFPTLRMKIRPTCRVNENLSVSRLPQTSQPTSTTR